MTLAILESELPSFFKGASHLYYEQLRGELIVMLVCSVNDTKSVPSMTTFLVSRAPPEPGRPQQEKQSEQRSQERAGSEAGRGKGKLYSKSQENLQNHRSR